MEVTAPSRISRDPRGAPPHAQPRGATIGRGGASRAVTRGAGRGLARPRPSALAWYPRAGRLASAPASWPRVCGVKKHTGNAPGAHLRGGELGAQPPRPGHHRAGTAPATRPGGAYERPRAASASWARFPPARPSRGNPLPGGPRGEAPAPRGPTQ